MKNARLKTDIESRIAEKIHEIATELRVEGNAISKAIADASKKIAKHMAKKLKDFEKKKDEIKNSMLVEIDKAIVVALKPKAEKPESKKAVVKKSAVKKPAANSKKAAKISNKESADVNAINTLSDIVVTKGASAPKKTTVKKTTSAKK